MERAIFWREIGVDLSALPRLDERVSTATSPLLALGVAWLRVVAQRPEEAMALLEPLEAAGTEPAATAQIRAHALWAAAQPAAAISVLETRLLQDPNDPVVLGLLGAILAVEHPPPARAEELLRAGLVIDPGSRQALLALSTLLAHSGRTDQATALHRRALQPTAPALHPDPRGASASPSSEEAPP